MTFLDFFRIPPKTVELKKGDTLSARDRRKVAHEIVRNGRSLARKDIREWRMYRQRAMSQETPNRRELANLLKEIAEDPKVTTTVARRILLSTGAEWQIVDANGDVDEETTKQMHDSKGFFDILNYIFEAPHYGTSLIEIDIEKTLTGEDIKATLIDRDHVEPITGFVRFDVNQEKGVYYRELAEFNTTIFEFGDPNDFGLLDKAVPYALYKKFAASCWSELAEIYGIPPRYMKTDTTDPTLMARAEQMMRDMGASAWWVIDNEEEFGFAQSVNTNGDIFKNLIQLCNNEISTLICGAILGEDTEHGNRSKEEVGLSMLDDLAKNDRKQGQMYLNRYIMPALSMFGFIPENSRFEFVANEDIEELWKKVVSILPYYEVDENWLRNKFGIEITGKRSLMAPTPPPTDPKDDDKKKKSPARKLHLVDPFL